MSNTTNKCFFLYTYLFNFVCPYIVDWSMRDEMSGMPKNTFDAIEVIVSGMSHVQYSVGFQTCDTTMPF